MSDTFGAIVREVRLLKFHTKPKYVEYFSWYLAFWLLFLILNQKYCA